VKFLGASGEFDWPRFRHVVRLMSLAQEILVDYASYPTAKIAETSHDHRPLGVGYANLGGLLMNLGVPYDSEQGGAWTARITAALHAQALETSCEVARLKGPFAAWKENSDSALGVLERHRKAWLGEKSEDGFVSEQFERVLRESEKHGLRNAQMTLVAPTGTIGLLMDCDTLGIEPDFSLVKTKQLVGGKALRLANRSVSSALKRLKYSEGEISELLKYVEKNGHLVGAKSLRPEHLNVFDCAIPPQGHPERRVSVAGHLRILTKAQPFLSGGISKTINLPQSASAEEIEKLYLEAWKLGLKALSIYRDGSKSVQPLCAEC
jgi:ribonucleoside-diphosphate reductase alpha chain